HDYSLSIGIEVGRPAACRTAGRSKLKRKIVETRKARKQSSFSKFDKANVGGYCGYCKAGGGSIYCQARKHESHADARLFRGAIFGAGDGIRTHDPNLGKVVLYP